MHWQGGYCPPPYPRSLCPLSSTEIVEPPEKLSWVSHWIYVLCDPETVCLSSGPVSCLCQTALLLIPVSSVEGTNIGSSHTDVVWWNGGVAPSTIQFFFASPWVYSKSHRRNSREEADSKCSSTLSLTFPLDGEMINATPLPFNLDSANLTGDWVGAVTSMDECGKSRHPQGFDPRPVQVLPNRYTYWRTAVQVSLTERT